MVFSNTSPAEEEQALPSLPGGGRNPGSPLDLHQPPSRGMRELFVTSGKGCKFHPPSGPSDTFLIRRSRIALLLLPKHHKVEAASLPPGSAESPDLPLGLLWHHPSWEGELITPGVRRCPGSPRVSSTDTHRWGWASGHQSPSSLLGFLRHYPGRGIRVPCYSLARLEV